MERPAENIRQDDAIEGSDHDQRAAWQRPELIRMAAGSAELGINVSNDVTNFS